MRRVILLLALMAPILTSCQLFQDNRTVVHLHPDGTEPSTVDYVRNLLEEGGYRVVMRSNTSPYRGHGSALVYGGGVLGRFEAYGIISHLEASGFVVPNVFEREAQNHRYTAKNMGLYLDPGHVGEKGQAEEIPTEPLSVDDVEFAAIDCEQNFTAHFERDGSVVFFSGEGDLLETTLWKLVDDQTLSVMGGQGNQYEVLASARQQEDGVRHIISLLPQGFYRLPYGCSYSGTLFEIR
ncbi:hypothetical protein [Marinimicrobium sp. ABcell2]|uniref:hypothetical protein n=1 Tax=Marinimicrobium sp. ABcell2 TaxID=3069751 RepID=UPI0027B09FDF|nr:hypothetical protein [Marinimicrobium sp. ABcell2]MDQ2075476.1 hypothetical protein [Marinimicrobium sp. ABcell2]